MLDKIVRHLQKRRQWWLHARRLPDLRTLEEFRQYIEQGGYVPPYLVAGEDASQRKRLESEQLLDTCKLDVAGMRVLDIGPGNGDFLDVCRKRGALTVGVDFDPFVVRWLQLRGHLAMRCNILRTIQPLQNNLFELIHLRGSIVVEYFMLVGEGRLRKLLADLDRLLNPVKGCVLMCPCFEVTGPQRMRKIADPLASRFTQVVAEFGYSPLPPMSAANDDPMYPVTYVRTV